MFGLAESSLHQLRLEHQCVVHDRRGVEIAQKGIAALEIHRVGDDHDARTVRGSTAGELHIGTRGVPRPDRRLRRRGAGPPPSAPARSREAELGQVLSGLLDRVRCDRTPAFVLNQAQVRSKFSLQK